MLPAVLALLFAIAVVLWAQGNDASEQAAFSQTLMLDVASVQAQLSARQESEQSRLQDLASQLAGRSSAAEQALAAAPAAIAGLDRLWNRLVWLDGANRVVARVDRKAPITGNASGSGNETLRIRNPGQAVHLVTALPDPAGQGQGRLLARYDISDLLQSTDLGWLTRRYEVSFLSELGEVIATTASVGAIPAGQAFEKPLDVFQGTTLRLVPMLVPSTWWQSGRIVSLLGALIVLGLVASGWLRREIQRVHWAVADARTEAAWRQSMEDSSLVGLRARDLQGRILYVNKTLCDMVGYSREELVGLVPPLPFWPRQSVEELMAQNRVTLSGAAPTEGYEARWVHRDGRLLDVVVYESALVDAYGVQFGWMGSIVDISQRKLLEERDRRHIEAMAQHARLNDLGLIASELAHELNQPLSSIASYSAGLQRALQKESVRDDVLLAVDEVNRSARKAGDIVNWIRRQSSRSAPQRQWADLNAVVAEVLAQRKASLVRHGIQVRTRLLPDLLQVAMDRIGVEQMVSNLLRNAVDATAGHTAAPCLTLSTDLWRDESGAVQGVCMAVADNGPGLEGRSIETLCSTFYSTKPTGMGLGLGICRSIAESHGGTLTARDLDQGGAEFSFTLPTGPQSS